MKQNTKKLIKILILCFINVSILPAANMANSENNKLLKLNLHPAWNGFYHPGKITEIGIEVFSKHGGMVNIKHHKIKQSFFLPAETPYFTSFPVVLTQDTLASFKLTRQDSKTSISKNIRLKPALKPSMAVIDNNGSVPLKLLDTLNKLNIKLLPSNASSLPRFSKAYQAIDAILISYSSFKRLENVQLNAFSHYIAECGKVIVFNFPDSIRDNLSAIAGCRGAFFLTSNASKLLARESIQYWLKSTSTTLPEATKLNEVSVKNLHTNSTLLFFYFTYIALILCLALFKVKKIVFLITPLLGSIITLSFWHKEPSKNIISWLEMSHLRSSARYTSLVHIDGQGLWNGSIALPTNAYSDVLPTTKFNDNTPALMNIEFSTSLLSTQLWQWQSSQFIQSPLKLEIVNNSPRIINLSNAIIYNSLLSWGEDIYSLPPLSPHKYWSFDASVPAELNTNLMKLFRQQSQKYNVAVLIPYASPLFQHFHTNEGWLLIHNEPTQTDL